MFRGGCKEKLRRKRGESARASRLVQMPKQSTTERSDYCQKTSTRRIQPRDFSLSPSIRTARARWPLRIVFHYFAGASVAPPAGRVTIWQSGETLRRPLANTFSSSFVGPSSACATRWDSPSSISRAIPVQHVRVVRFDSVSLVGGLSF